jgi:hypothetical protein
MGRTKSKEHHRATAEILQAADLLQDRQEVSPRSPLRIAVPRGDERQLAPLALRRMCKALAIRPGDTCDTFRMLSHRVSHAQNIVNKSLMNN